MIRIFKIPTRINQMDLFDVIILVELIFKKDMSRIASLFSHSIINLRKMIDTIWSKFVFIRVAAVFRSFFQRKNSFVPK